MTSRCKDTTTYATRYRNQSQHGATFLKEHRPLNLATNVDGDANGIENGIQEDAQLAVYCIRLSPTSSIIGDTFLGSVLLPRRLEWSKRGPRGQAHGSRWQISAGISPPSPRRSSHPETRHEASQPRSLVDRSLLAYPRLPSARWRSVLQCTCDGAWTRRCDVMKVR